MYPNLGEILDRKRIIVCVGSGGVGKTTTAAALALESARNGKRTLVLTIDPAKRLANALGLVELGHAVQRVPDAMLDAAGSREPGGELHAMMLDQKRAFDEIVTSHASDPAAVKRILDNPVYSQISSSLAGAQEYAAMAKLHDFDADGDWDLIVVDTPPTANALDFLDAPEKLTNAIDSPAIEWFRKLRGAKSGGWSVVGRTGAYVIKRLSKFVGTKFIDDLSIFFTEFNDVLGGFRSRAQETFALLREDRVGFVLVASPEPMAVREALYFHQRLIASSMPFASFVVNKVHSDLPVDVDKRELVAAIGAIPTVAALSYKETTIRMATEQLINTHAELQVLAKADVASIHRLEIAGDGNNPLVCVPFFREDMRDIAKLGELGRYLVNGH